MKRYKIVLKNGHEYIVEMNSYDRNGTWDHGEQWFQTDNIKVRVADVEAIITLKD